MKKYLVLIILLSTLIFASMGWCVPPIPSAPLGPIYNNGTCTTTMTIDYRKGQSQEVALGGSCTVSWILPPSGFCSSIALKVTQHTGAHYNIIWTATKWDSGLVPLITQTDGAVNFINCYLDNNGAYCTSGSGAFY
jgi:hypothetical protein